MKDFDFTSFAKENLGSRKLRSPELFSQLSLPKTKEEQWRYFPMKELSFPNLRDLGDRDLKSYIESLTISGYQNLVFVNSKLVTRLSSRELGFEVKESESLPLDWEGDSFVSAMCGNLSDKITEISIRAKEKTKLQIVQIATEESSHFNFLKISLQKNSQLDLLETQLNLSTESVNASRSIFLVAEEASLSHSSRVFGEGAKNYLEARYFVEKSANVFLFQLDLLSKLMRRRIEVDLIGEKANAELFGFYLLTEKEKLNYIIDIRHKVPFCTSSQLYKGILHSSSRAAFDAKVFVAPGAMGTDSSQLNKTVLLSNQAELDTKPQLEIYADDVKCSHGATLGAFNQEELFYFQSRAIPKDMAFQMLAKGFAEDVLSKLKCESLHLELSKAFSDRFAGIEVNEDEI